MGINSIVLSSGHGKYVRGASGILDEVDEARRVVEALADALETRGIEVITFHDDVSQSQNENLNRIVDFHNAQMRDLDISIHFNAYEQVEKPMGTECLYLTQQKAAARVAEAIASVGFINRGAKKRTDLYFLNQTEMPALLFEVCFVDSEADAALYDESFDDIIEAIANLAGDEEDGIETQPPPEDVALFYAKGKCSHFGGPGDTTGVEDAEGLAFIYEVKDVPHLFLPYQPEGSSGLARRLNPYVHYLACRWDYSITPKDMLANSGEVALVRSLKDPDRALTAFPADWGPHEDTGRVADLSPGLMDDLGLTTDDEVEVIYPYDED